MILEFERCRDNNTPIFINSQEYYDSPKRTLRDNGKIYHILKANNLGSVQNIYQDKASMDMTMKEI